MYSLILAGKQKKFGSLREAAEWYTDMLERNPLTVLASMVMRCRGQPLDAVDVDVWKLYLTHIKGTKPNV